MRTFAILVTIVLVAACGHVPVSPLAAAARAGDLSEVDRLLAAGADINQGSGVNNWPPVIHAVHKGQVKAIERLLDRGAVADQSVRDRALNVAQGSGDEAEVRAILAAFPVRGTSLSR
jgi:ankyrin repeat protein